MIIDRQDLFKIVRAEQGKVLTRIENNEVQIFEKAYVPLTMEDDELRARYEEVDKNNFIFEIKEK